MAKGYARRRKNGKWQLEVDLGKTINGKKRNRKYKTIEAKGQKEANIELANFITELTGEGYIEEKEIMLNAFIINHWLEKCAKKRLAHTTLESHLSIINNRIMPAFQYFKLNEIQPIHLINFFDNLQEDGMRLDGKKGKLSSASIFLHYRVLNNIFNFAVEIGFLKESPLKKIDKPKVEYKESEVYTLEEARKLIECLNSEVNNPHWQIIIKLAITTGMRRSELFGLEFKHIDLDKKIISVEQALTYSKSEGYQVHEIKKGNKTSKRRKIVLSNTLIEDIKTLAFYRKKERFAASELWDDGKYNFILANPVGKPYNPNSMKNWWERFLRRHNLKYINIHALRHTAATTLINLGVHPKLISERLGHSDIKTTMNIYGHALQQADEIASSKLDEAIFGDIKTQ